MKTKPIVNRVLTPMVNLVMDLPQIEGTANPLPRSAQPHPEIFCESSLKITVGFTFRRQPTQAPRTPRADTITGSGRFCRRLEGEFAADRFGSEPKKAVPSVSGTVPWMRSPATHVPFLLPRSSIETSRPVTFSRAWWRETESASI